MLSHLAEVCCACMPAQELAALAEVRVVAGIEVYQEGEKAWVRWESDAERVLACLLAIPGVMLYAWRDGRWHRPGAVLPALDVPTHGKFRPLHEVLFPASVQPWIAKLNDPTRHAGSDHSASLSTAAQKRETEPHATVEIFHGWERQELAGRRQAGASGHRARRRALRPG